MRGEAETARPLASGSDFPDWNVHMYKHADGHGAPTPSPLTSHCCSRGRGHPIEVMVVIVILGVLAALIVPPVLGRPDEAQVVAAKRDIGAIMQAQALQARQSTLSSARQGLQALVQKPTTQPVPENWKAYLEKPPNDPWGSPCAVP